MGWDTILGDFANIETIVAGLVGSVGTVAYQHYVKDAETLLEDCRKDLEEVKARLDEIPPERQEKIRAAAERDVCKSLDKIRESLLRSAAPSHILSMLLRDLNPPSLSDDRCELSQRLGSSSYWQRKGPRTQLRDDIYTLKDSVKRLWKDTCVCSSNFQPVQVFTNEDLTEHNKLSRQGSEASR